MIIKGNYKASNIFMKRGILLDLSKGCYTIFNKLFSFIPFNEGCKPIPKPEYLLLFRTLYAKCEACELEDFDKGNGSVIQLSIVYNKNRRLIVDEGKDLGKLMSKAAELAKFYNIKVRDAASNRKIARWLSKEELGVAA